MSFVEKYIDQIGKEEGVLIHKNKGESDITLPYGLYKKYDSAMYKELVSIAKQIGISKNTTEWNEADIEEMNKIIAPIGVGVKKLAIEFYEDFIKKAHLNIYPPSCRVVIFSLYVNSPYWCTRAVQRTIINMIKSDRLGLTLKEASIEDGFWGRKTANAISYIRSHKTVDFSYYFEEAIISNMKDMYEAIVKKDPSQQKNLDGWKNRVRKFQAIK